MVHTKKILVTENLSQEFFLVFGAKHIWSNRFYQKKYHKMEYVRRCVCFVHVHDSLPPLQYICKDLHLSSLHENVFSFSSPKKIGENIFVKPQLNHNSTQPNITLVGLNMKMALHTTSTHRNSMPAISPLLLTRF